MNVNSEHVKIEGIRLPLPVSGDRFDSWKQVAAYLGREVRTVQRWEKLEELPVRRHIHVKGGTVFAFKNEIDAWLTSRGQKLGKSHSIEKRLAQTATPFNLPPRVVKQMLSAFRLWLAFEAHEKCQDPSTVKVADLQLVPGDPDIFPEKAKSQQMVRRRKLASAGNCCR